MLPSQIVSCSDCCLINFRVLSLAAHSAHAQPATVMSEVRQENHDKPLSREAEASAVNSSCAC